MLNPRKKETITLKNTDNDEELNKADKFLNMFQGIYPDAEAYLLITLGGKYGGTSQFHGYVQDLSTIDKIFHEMLREYLPKMEEASFLRHVHDQMQKPRPEILSLPGRMTLKERMKKVPKKKKK